MNVISIPQKFLKSFLASIISSSSTRLLLQEKNKLRKKNVKEANNWNWTMVHFNFSYVCETGSKTQRTKARIKGKKERK